MATSRSATPASVVSTVNSVGREAGTPSSIPGPLTFTLEASCAGKTDCSNGLQR